MNTSTSIFQKNPDFYYTKEDCIKGERNKQNTNPRYRDYLQIHFTAGDVQQFQEFRNKTNGKVCENPPDLKDSKGEDNIFSGSPVQEAVLWEKYHKIPSTAVDNTFMYIFEKLKKGIFIKIKDGKLNVFLPFSKRNYVNEWADRIKIDPKFEGGLLSFIKRIQFLSGYKFDPRFVNTDVSTWYGNNALFRYEYPLVEGDTNNSQIAQIFSLLCKERNVPDIEFFVNRRDYPLLKNDGTEPYNHMFDSENQPLVSHNYSKYAPLLSMVTGEKFADIPMPTGDDISRIFREEGKYFPKSCKRDFKMSSSLSWKEKKPVAVFRGTSTGAGITISSNPRLKVAFLSSKGEKDTDGLPFLDAGITAWNLRPRKLQGEKYLVNLEPDTLPFGLVQPMTPEKQAEHKYIIHIQGHVAAFRLSLELESKSCILLVESKYKLWFQNMLKPWKHYVPVKEDLSDLIPKIRWCKQNDDKAEKIAINGYRFFKRYLTKKGILDYLQKLLWDIKKQTGTYLYNVSSLGSVQKKIEEEILRGFTPWKVSLPKENISFGKIIDFNFCQALQSSLYEKKLTLEMREEISPEKIFSMKIVGKNFKNFFILEKTGKIFHDAFVGINLNSIRRFIPNFVYTLGYSSGNTSSFDKLYLEKIKGESLYQYIKGEDFSFSSFVKILHQVSLALQMAQDLKGFLHNDLTPWNIMLVKVKPQKVKYVVNGGVVEIDTDLIPVIIDYGRSHIVYKNMHYGYVTNTFQDVLCLLLVSISEILQFPINKEDLRTVFKLANYITETGYRKTQFTNVKELANFCKHNRKCSDLLYSEKYELGNKTPLDFAKYLEKEFKIKTKNSLLDTSIFAIKLEGLETKKCNFPEMDEFLLKYTNLVLEQSGGKPVGLEKLRKSEKNNVLIKIPSYHLEKDLEVILSDPKTTISELRKIRDLKDEGLELFDYSICKEMLYSLFTPYFSEKEREKFLGVYSGLLNFPILKAADKDSLISYSNIIYKENLKNILTLPVCKDTKKLKKRYEKILDFEIEEKKEERKVEKKKKKEKKKEEKNEKKSKEEKKQMNNLTYIDDFLSPEEEKELISFIDNQKWNTSLSRRTQHYGYEYSYNSRDIKKIEKIPEIFDNLLERMEKYFKKKPDQLIINEYVPGQGIAPHIDHVKNFGPVVASISLLSPVDMDFDKGEGKTTSLILKARSVIFLEGDARYKWKHSIAKRKTVTVDGKRIPRGRRVSLTFRTVNKG